jgi:hypothetical protein
VPLGLTEFVVSVEMLAWAQANGCPWEGGMCKNIVAGGHLAVLQWAREHGCPWDEGTSNGAARFGHLEVMKWAREHGCPWSELTFCYAALGGYPAVLQWARAVWRAASWAGAYTRPLLTSMEACLWDTLDGFVTKMFQEEC